MNATRSCAARRGPSNWAQAERHGMSWSQKLLTGAVEKTYGRASVHFRFQPEPHAKLARVSADAEPAERFRGARPGSIGGRDHGGPRPTGREKTLLECSNRGNRRAIPGRLHGRTEGVIETPRPEHPAAIRPVLVLALALRSSAPSPGAAQQQLVEPFTPSARWSQYLHRTYSPLRLGFLAVDTAIDDLLREPACWDSGASSYARRYGRGVRAPRHQEHHRTGHRSPDRRGFTVPQVPIVLGSGKSLERSAILRDGANARWNETPRLHPLFLRRSHQRSYGELDQAAYSTGVVGAVSRVVYPRPGADKHDG